MDYKPLPQTTTKYGYTYNQLKRTEKIALYEVLNEKGENRGYEVFEIKLNKGGEVWGQQLEPQEIYPSKTVFGHTAWFCRDLVRAEYWWNIIEERLKERHANT